MSLTVGSLFSGIGGFDLGFHRAGYDVRWQVEIEPSCVRVLTRHWPDVRRYADINAVVYGRASNRQRHGLLLEPVDVIVGGFPCQDVSVAGKREGLSGARSGLFFAFMRALRLLKPKWVVIENVPGLLSSQRGRDFHTVLSEVAECGFRRAYRILDSQYFGVPQRRRRVFIVGRAGTTVGDPATVLFESLGSDGDSAASRETRARVASTLRGRSHRAGVHEPGRGGEDDVNVIVVDNHDGKAGAQAGTLRADCHGANPMIAATLNSDGNEGGFRTEPGEHLIPVGIHANQRGELRTSSLAGSLNQSRSGKQYEGVFVPRERARALTGSMHKRHDDDTDTLIASPITASAGHHGHSSPRGDGRDNLISDIAFALRRDPGGIGQGHNTTYPTTSAGVRRLTPLECERLQGFPDGWTCLCGEGHKGSAFCTCDDTPRYKGLGNAVTVNVAEWIARRLHAEAQRCS